MRIFLTGMMGCGKTFWAEKVAAWLNIDHVDLDQYIEEKEGKTIAVIFESLGEVIFRSLETQYLLEIISLYPDAIVATGGGTPCSQQNMITMKTTGKTVYLKTGTDILYQRISAEGSHRPLLGGLTDEKLQKKLDTLLEEREEYYLQSDLTVEMAGTDDQTIINKILKLYV